MSSGSRKRKEPPGSEKSTESGADATQRQTAEETQRTNVPGPSSPPDISFPAPPTKESFISGVLSSGDRKQSPKSPPKKTQNSGQSTPRSHQSDQQQRNVDPSNPPRKKQNSGQNSGQATPRALASEQQQTREALVHDQQGTGQLTGPSQQQRGDPDTGGINQQRAHQVLGKIWNIFFEDKEPYPFQDFVVTSTDLRHIIETAQTDKLPTGSSLRIDVPPNVIPTREHWLKAIAEEAKGRVGIQAKDQAGSSSPTMDQVRPPQIIEEKEDEEDIDLIDQVLEYMDPENPEPVNIEILRSKGYPIPGEPGFEDFLASRRATRGTRGETRKSRVRARPTYHDIAELFASQFQAPFQITSVRAPSGSSVQIGSVHSQESHQSAQRGMTQAPVQSPLGLDPVELANYSTSPEWPSYFKHSLRIHSWMRYLVAMRRSPRHFDNPERGQRLLGVIQDFHRAFAHTRETLDLDEVPGSDDLVPQYHAKLEEMRDDETMKWNRMQPPPRVEDFETEIIQWQSYLTRIRTTPINFRFAEHRVKFATLIKAFQQELVTTASACLGLGPQQAEEAFRLEKEDLRLAFPGEIQRVPILVQGYTVQGANPPLQTWRVPPVLQPDIVQPPSPQRPDTPPSPQRPATPRASPEALQRGEQFHLKVWQMIVYLCAMRTRPQSFQGQRADVFIPHMRGVYEKSRIANIENLDQALYYHLTKDYILAQHNVVVTHPTSQTEFQLQSQRPIENLQTDDKLQFIELETYLTNMRVDPPHFRVEIQQDVAGILRTLHWELEATVALCLGQRANEVIPVEERTQFEFPELAHQSQLNQLLLPGVQQVQSQQLDVDMNEGADDQQHQEEGGQGFPDPDQQFPLPHGQQGPAGQPPPQGDQPVEPAQAQNPEEQQPRPRVLMDFPRKSRKVRGRGGDRQVGQVPRDYEHPADSQRAYVEDYKNVEDEDINLFENERQRWARYERGDGEIEYFQEGHFYGAKYGAVVGNPRRVVGPTEAADLDEYRVLMLKELKRLESNIAFGMLGYTNYIHMDKTLQDDLRFYIVSYHKFAMGEMHHCEFLCDRTRNITLCGCYQRKFGELNTESNRQVLHNRLLDMFTKDITAAVAHWCSATGTQLMNIPTYALRILDAYYQRNGASICFIRENVENMVQQTRLKADQVISYFTTLKRREREGGRAPRRRVLRNVPEHPKSKQHRTKFRPEITNFLTQWIEQHLDYPCPITTEKAELMRYTRLSSNQIAWWFKNYRKINGIKFVYDIKTHAELCRRGSGRGMHPRYRLVGARIEDPHIQWSDDEEEAREDDADNEGRADDDGDDNHGGDDHLGGGGGGDDDLDDDDFGDQRGGAAYEVPQYQLNAQNPPENQQYGNPSARENPNVVPDDQLDVDPANQQIENQIPSFGQFADERNPLGADERPLKPYLPDQGDGGAENEEVIDEARKVVAIRADELKRNLQQALEKISTNAEQTADVAMGDVQLMPLREPCVSEGTFETYVQQQGIPGNEFIYTGDGTFAPLNRNDALQETEPQILTRSEPHARGPEDEDLVQVPRRSFVEVMQQVDQEIDEADFDFEDLFKDYDDQGQIEEQQNFGADLRSDEELDDFDAVVNDALYEVDEGLSNAAPQGDIPIDERARREFMQNRWEPEEDHAKLLNKRAKALIKWATSAKINSEINLTCKDALNDLPRAHLGFAKNKPYHWKKDCKPGDAVRECCYNERFGDIDHIQGEDERLRASLRRFDVDIFRMICSVCNSHNRAKCRIPRFIAEVLEEWCLRHVQPTLRKAVPTNEEYAQFERDLGVESKQAWDFIRAWRAACWTVPTVKRPGPGHVQRRRCYISQEASTYLRNWFEEHLHHPYLTPNTSGPLCQATQLTHRQIQRYLESWRRANGFRVVARNDEGFATFRPLQEGDMKLIKNNVLR